MVHTRQDNLHLRHRVVCCGRLLVMGWWWLAFFGGSMIRVCIDFIYCKDIPRGFECRNVLYKLWFQHWSDVLSILSDPRPGGKNRLSITYVRVGKHRFDKQIFLLKCCHQALDSLYNVYNDLQLEVKEKLNIVTRCHPQCWQSVWLRRTARK